MFILPDELIQYIYSFDANEYCKRKYNESLTQMKTYFTKNRIDDIMRGYSQYFQIYKKINFYDEKEFPWYVLNHFKTFGNGKQIVINCLTFHNNKLLKMRKI